MTDYMRKMTNDSFREQQKAMRAQMKEQARERLVDEFCELLSHSESEHLKWKQAAIDLMEGLYMVWMSQRVTNGEGSPASFRELVARGCTILHMHIPANPHACVYKASLRRGIRRAPFFDRYLLQMERNPAGCILSRYVGK